MSADRGRRLGVTVVETLVGLTLGWLIAYLVLTTLARQRTVQARLTHRSEALATVRMSRIVVGEEARAAAPARDGWVVATDEVGIRAYRGVAFPCSPPGGTDEVEVRAGGSRLADPEKDSVLLVDFTGSGPAVALLERHPAPTVSCGGGEPDAVERWRLSGEVPQGTLILRYFERGSYHLSGRALRYRRGQGGRQPLTPEVLSDAEGGFEVGGAGLRLVTRDARGARTQWPRIRLRPAEEPDAR